MYHDYTEIKETDKVIHRTQLLEDAITDGSFIQYLTF
jgi:hypothetical protein